MGVIAPELPGFDLDEWARRPERDRVRMMCESWAVQGFGAPAVAYVSYVLKLVLYIGLWTVFRSPVAGGGGRLRHRDVVGPPGGLREGDPSGPCSTRCWDWAAGAGR